MTETSRKRNISIDKLDETFRKYPVTFRSAVEVHAAAGRQAANNIRKNPETVEQWYTRFTSEFANTMGRNELDILVTVLHHAMSRFAEFHSKVPAREEVLVGLFRGAISDSLSRFDRQFNELRGEPLPLAIYAADLNIKSREKKTGGDIAFIIDVGTAANTRTIVPVCFQAKRAAPQDTDIVDVRRFNKSDPIEGDHQLRALENFSDEGANCAYLFFNNHIDFALSSAILPLVKSIGDILRTDQPLDIDLSSETIDVASYIFHLIANREKAVSSMTDLQPLLSKLVEGDVSHLVLLSSDNMAWKNMQTMLGSKMSEKYVSASSAEPKRVFYELEAAFELSNSYDLREVKQGKGYSLTRRG